MRPSDVPTCDVFLKFQLSEGTGCAGSYRKETSRQGDRGREARLPGSPPSEPYMRFSRIRLSGQ